MKEYFKAALTSEGAVMEYLPFISVVVPIMVPTTFTLANGIVSPFSSNTVPETTLVWANRPNLINR